MAPALPAAHAEDSRPQPADRLGEHPAVLVGAQGGSTRSEREFLPASGRLSWSLERPLSEGEHPAVLVAHRHSAPKIDPNDSSSRTLRAARPRARCSRTESGRGGGRDSVS